MPSIQPNPGPREPNPNETPDLGDIIDIPAIANWLKYFVYLGWQKKWAVLACGGLFATVTTVWLVISPRTYTAGTTLLVVENSYVKPTGEDRSLSLTQTAAKLLPTRENLEKIIRRTDLLNEDIANRSIKEKIEAKISSLYNPPPKEEDRLYYTTRGLEQQLTIESTWSSVTLGMTWNNPVMAYKLVEAAKAVFLELCHERDVSSIIESISILEGQASELRGRVDQAKSDFNAYIESKEASHKETIREAAKEAQVQVAQTARADAVPAAPPEFVAEAERVAARLQELDSLIASTEQSLGALSGARQSRLASLHAKLAELKTRYTEAHPAVVEAQQQLATASRPTQQMQETSAQLSELRQERSSLVLAAPGSTPAPRTRRAPSVSVPIATLPRIGELMDITAKRDAQYGRLQGTAELADAQYTSIQRQIQSRRLDLELAQRAFEQRYKIAVEAEVPRKADKPRAKSVIGSMIGGLLFGLCLVALSTLRRGLIERSWQLQQALALPVVSTIQLPSSSSTKRE